MSSHPEQGWSLLCNGVVLFEDTGELLPNGQIIAPRHRCVPQSGPREVHQSHCHSSVSAA